jgi:hypothetical protein
LKLCTVDVAAWRIHKGLENRVEVVPNLDQLITTHGLVTVQLVRSWFPTLVGSVYKAVVVAVVFVASIVRSERDTKEPDASL